MTLHRVTAKFLPSEGAIGVLVEKVEASAQWDVTKSRPDGDEGDWEVEAKYMVSADSEIIVSTNTGQTVATARTDQRGRAIIRLAFEKLVAAGQIHTEVSVKAEGVEELVLIPMEDVYARIPIADLYNQAMTSYAAKRDDEAARQATQVRLRDTGYNKSEMLFFIATDHHLADRLDEAPRAYLGILLLKGATAKLKRKCQERLQIRDLKL